MSADATADKLKDYLASLSPQALALIVRGLNGRSNSATDALILTAAKSLMSEAAARSVPTSETAASESGEEMGPVDPRTALKQALFVQCREFEATEPIPYKMRGLIASSSMDAIWAWFARDLSADEIGALVSEIEGSAVLALPPSIEEVAGEVFNRAAQRVADAEFIPVGRQRLAGQIGSEAALEDLEEILALRDIWPEFEPFVKSLPEAIVPTDCESGGDLVRSVDQQFRSHAEQTRWIGAILYSRATSPVVLPRLAVRLAGSDKAKDIAASKYAGLVELAFYELERRISALAEAMVEPYGIRDPESEIEAFHERMRALQVEIEFEVSSPWQQTLASMRRRISDLLRRRIEALAGILQRALRLSRHRDEAGLHVDADAAEDARAGLRLLMVAKRASDSIALNDLLSKTDKSVEQALEILTENAFAKVRTSDGDMLPSWRIIARHAVAMNEIYFGPDYSALLQRSLENLSEQPAAKTG